MKTNKAKRIEPKKVWAFRISEKMLGDLTRLAAIVEMRPSEYIRRLIEDHLSDISKKEL